MLEALLASTSTTPSRPARPTAPACACARSAIDTGKLIKEFRAASARAREESAALAVAERWAAVERAARGGPARGGGRRGCSASGAVRGGAGRGAPARERRPRARAGRSDAAARARRGCRDTQRARARPRSTCRRASTGSSATPRPRRPSRSAAGGAGGGLARAPGMPLWIPPDVAGHCCATPWSSKGYRRGQEHMARPDGRRAVALDRRGRAAGGHGRQLLRARPDPGRRPVLDEDARASVRRDRGARLDRCGRTTTCCRGSTCGDASPRWPCTRRARPATWGSGQARGACGRAGRRGGGAGRRGCCGMAGDRGLLHPELPASALRDEAERARRRATSTRTCAANRTCEIGLQQVTGRPYASFVFLLERLTRPS